MSRWERKISSIMEIQLFTGTVNLGSIEAAIVDESMGVIGGTLNPSTAYFSNFQSFFRLNTETVNWDKLAALDLTAILKPHEVINCAGGICITDVEEFDEIEVEVCGLDQQMLNKFR